MTVENMLKILSKEHNSLPIKIITSFTGKNRVHKFEVLARKIKIDGKKTIIFIVND